ncbi:MAG: oxygen-independent coproporphyrinogen III oxidase [Aestuariivirga sp.]
MDQRLLPFALQDVPRYTSYPTAVQFHDGFSGDLGDQWLAELPTTSSLSVYMHVPFCQQLCWYCGCHTSVPNSYGRASAYVDNLVRDITRSGKLSGVQKGNVKHLHFGGGTPTFLSNMDLGRILARINGSFGLASGAEVALESDPRGITRDRAFGLAAMGFNRISFGVQDFALPVQMKINRLQTYGLVAHVTDLLRGAGFTSINFDLMYGLPAQTVGSVRQTAKQAAALRPNRISVFGYAHVPWFKKHQRMISDAELPGVSERYEQASAITEELAGAGYVAIGLDHFALPDDALAISASAGMLRRNFQGYTTDTADALIAFGASAISEFPQGFTQAARDTLAWSEAIAEGKSPVMRGLATTAEDRMRAAIIEQVMCNFSADFGQIADQHGFNNSVLVESLIRLQPLAEAGLASIDGSTVRVPQEHRLFLRSVACAFDNYFTGAKNRHAKAI